MSLSVGYIRSLDFDQECREALAWLAERVTKYPAGRYMPPLTPRITSQEPKQFVSLSLRIGRKSRLTTGATITRMDVFDGCSTISCVGTPAEIGAAFAKRVLTSKRAGYMLVTTGQRRHAIEVLLDSVGRSLLELGYSLQPCAGSSGVQFVTIRRGKRRWDIVYAETALGLSLSSIESLGDVAERQALSKASLAERIYAACDAAQSFLMGHFGVALNLTAGMTAMAAARRHLPVDFKKWRPDPLLVAMERAGRGYRGGMTYATRFRGKSWRIDVNRQYTHALRTALPHHAAFGRYQDTTRTPHGVFVCRVQLTNVLPYPLGVWEGVERGFVVSTVGRGSYVCILHTSEFPALTATGATITPTYGFVFTHTFTLAGFVDAIQAVIDTYGRDSAEAKMTKPLGNYVYGKFGQSPTRSELLYSLIEPDETWFPYFNDQGEMVETLWEKTVTRHTSSQHVDIAGTITGAARAQTSQTWALLSALGTNVVRCHTDSLTVDVDPSDAITISESEIGAWKLERAESDTIIVGANAYIDQGEAHIAGVSDPTYEMIERLYDGHVVAIAQDVAIPLREGRRGTRTVQREYRSSAGRS